MTKTLEQQLADAHAERDEARETAAESARIADESLALLAVATAAATNPPAPAKPAPAPPPPAPTLPPPPRPAFNEYVRMDSREKAAVRAAYGSDFEEKAHAEMLHGNTLRNARGGAARDDRRLTPQIVEDRAEKAAPFDSSQYYVGAPQPRVFPDVKPMTNEQFEAARAAAMNPPR